MNVGAFLENFVLIAAVAAVGAGVLAGIGALVLPWREVWRVWWTLTAGFAVLALMAALPTLLTGYEYSLMPAPCPRSLVGGPSCY